MTKQYDRCVGCAGCVERTDAGHLFDLSRARRTWAAVISLWAASGAIALACPVCYRIDDAPTTAGIRAAVVVLISVTGVVLGGFGVFLAGFLKRARALAKAEAETR